jgi:hypothetical protein
MSVGKFPDRWKTPVLKPFGRRYAWAPYPAAIEDGFGFGYFLIVFARYSRISVG